VAKKNLKFIDLFCGCGGFSTGLEAAGHECLLGLDFDKHAVESFKRNHKNALGLCADISKVSKKELLTLLKNQKVDMVVGGPPCQGFSTVGKGDANDERNALFKHFVRIVGILKPKVVLFENVTGILAKKNEFILKQIFKEFEGLGYHMDAKVLDAAEYGVPSHRRRTIIMGVMNDLPVYPNPVKKVKTVQDVLKKLKDNKAYLNHEIESALIKKDIDEKRLAKIPPGGGIRYERDQKKYLPKRLWFDVDWGKLRENRFRQTRLQRLPLDKPAPTILTSRSMYYHPLENRHLTVREAALCQSFPMRFQFLGPISAQFRQIGNAVPPELAKKIGLCLHDLSFRKKKVIVKRNTKELNSKAFNYKEKKYA
jgi:DNA (cytosine-5)-methyltransferase 1